MDRSNQKVLVLGAVLVIIGIVLSGPPMVFLVEYLKPQPKWVDVDTFVSHFHKVQTLPYWFGFILLIGNILFIASASRLPNIGNKIQSTLAIICLIIYSTLVTINYAIQTTTVPAMVTNPNITLEIFSMTNPTSLCWTIEMFAYAILGVSYWLVAMAFRGMGLLRVIKYLMIINGVASVLGILIPVIDPELLLESGSYIGYVIWNIFIVLIMALIIIAFKNEKKQSSV